MLKAKFQFHLIFALKILKIKLKFFASYVTLQILKDVYTVVSLLI